MKIENVSNEIVEVRLSNGSCINLRPTDKFTISDNNKPMNLDDIKESVRVIHNLNETI
jgi:hypothetical protein